MKGVELVRIIKRGGVAVMPTDTIYGVVGSALKPRTVARIYRLRRRNLKKPFLVLVASPRDLARFGVRPIPRIRAVLGKLWPGPVTVILPCPSVALRGGGGPSPSAKFRYLHRGTETIAFRLPRPRWLRALLKKTGPLVAPSANPEGKPPARTVGAAKAYFGNRVDCYVDGGTLRGTHSTLVEIRR